MAKKHREDNAPAAKGLLLLLAWRDAADCWQRLQSDPAEAKCRAARAAYYRAVLGAVPPLKGAHNG